MKHSKKANQDLHRLRDIAREFARDDGGTSIDEQLVRADNKVLYAIDSSEVFSYVFLGKLSYLSADHNGGVALGISFNEMVLHELLLSGRFHIFMLPSHRLEIRQLIETIHERELSELGNVLAALTAKHEIRPALKIALSAYAANKHDGALAARIVNEASRDAPNLFLLARVPNARPRARLQRLLKTMNLNPLEVLIGADQHQGSIEDSVVTAALAEFQNRRPFTKQSSNRVDAYAVAYLASLVARPPPKTTYRFVSRSQVFQDVCDALSAQGVVPRSVPDAIRHPRSFSTYVLARTAKQTVAELVQQRSTSVGTFLSALNEQGKAIWQSATPESLDDSVQAISHAVRELERIAMLSSISDAIDSVAGGGSTSFHTDLSKLVALLRSQAEIRDAVRGRAQEVVDKLSSSAMDIAGSIALSLVSDQPAIAALEADIHSMNVRHFGNKPVSVTVARFGFSPAPFSIEFYSTRIHRKIKDGDPPYAALSQFVSSGDFEASYERWLAAAYLLGLNEDWQLALQFVTAAISRPFEADKLSKHEGYYFQAVARRHALDWTKDNIIDSVQDVQRASELRSTAHGGDDDGDTRYLNEMAILTDQLIKIGVPQSEILSLGMRDKPLAMWEEVIRGNAEVGYKLNAYNNIAFYYLQEKNDVKLRDSLKKLIEFTALNNFEFVSLPPSVQDTILSARVFLSDFPTSQELALAKRKLQDIQKNAYIRKRPVRSETVVQIKA